MSHLLYDFLLRQSARPFRPNASDVAFFVVAVLLAFVALVVVAWDALATIGILPALGALAQLTPAEILSGGGWQQALSRPLAETAGGLVALGATLLAAAAYALVILAVLGAAVIARLRGMAGGRRGPLTWVLLAVVGALIIVYPALA